MSKSDRMVRDAYDKQRRDIKATADRKATRDKADRLVREQKIMRATKRER